MIKVKWPWIRSRSVIVNPERILAARRIGHLDLADRPKVANSPARQNTRRVYNYTQAPYSGLPHFNALNVRPESVSTACRQCSSRTRSSRPTQRAKLHEEIFSHCLWIQSYNSRRNLHSETLQFPLVALWCPFDSAWRNCKIGRMRKSEPIVNTKDTSILITVRAQASH